MFLAQNRYLNRCTEMVLDDRRDRSHLEYIDVEQNFKPTVGITSVVTCRSEYSQMLTRALTRYGGHHVIMSQG